MSGADNRTYVNRLKTGLLFLLIFILSGCDQGNDTSSYTSSPDIDNQYATQNQPPNVKITASQSFVTGEVVILDGSASSDPDGDTLSYQWTQTKGPEIILSDSTSPSLIFVAPSVAQPTKFSFDVTVHDGKSSSAATTSVLISPLADNTSPGDQDIDRDTKFISVSAAENGKAVSLVEDTVLRIQFDSDGNLSADAGCNSMFGAYKIVDGILATEQLATTEIGCDPKRHAQDEWFVAFLQSSPLISADGGRLIMKSAPNDAIVIEITFMDEEVATPDLALWDTTWIVDTIINDDIAMNTITDNPATLDFSQGGTLQFYTGCNQGFATYEVVADQLILGDVGWSERGCADANRQDLEMAVLNVFGVGESITWNIAVDRLLLRVKGVALGFRAN